MSQISPFLFSFQINIKNIYNLNTAPMETPPRLSFVCPLPWQNMNGDERSKFCSQCGHHISNISLLSHQERLALLERARVSRVCGTYYVRLSGELVTQDNPLSARERSRIKQFGVSTLSATALVIAAGCMSPIRKAETPQTMPDAAEIQPERKTDVNDRTINGDKKTDDEIVLLTGIMEFSVQPPPKTHGPHTK